MSDKHTYFKNLIKHDMLFGIVYKYYKYIFLAGAVILMCSTFFYDINLHNLGFKTEYSANFIDCIIYLFRGMEVYVPMPDNPESVFKIPVAYLFTNIFTAYIIGSYSVEDLYSSSNILIRIRKKKYWWLSKCIWVVLNVFVIYFIIYLICFILTIANSGSLLEPTAEINSAVSKVAVEGVGIGSLLTAVIVLPVVTSIAVSLFQSMLSLILKPIYSYIVIIALIVVSAYFDNIVLIGNYFMLLRNSVVLPGGINSITAIIIVAVIALVSVLISTLRFEKIDFISK